MSPRKRDLWGKPPETHETEQAEAEEVEAEEVEPEEVEPEEVEPEEVEPEEVEPEMAEVEPPEPRHRARGRTRVRLRKRKARHGVHDEEVIDEAPFEEGLDEDEEDEDEEEEFDEVPFEKELEEGPERPRLGPRRAAGRRRRRRRAGLRGIVGGLIGAAVAAALVAGPYVASRNDDGNTPGRGADADAAEKGPTTILVYGTRERHGGADQEAIWMTLFSYDPLKKEGAAVQIPSHTAAEIPGRGLESLNTAYSSGGIPLLLVSIENVLGVQIDRHLEVSDRDARVLFSATGPIDVNVPEDVRVSVGRKQTRVVFGQGEQRLAAPFLVRLLYTRGLDADDIDFGSRHLAFWDSFFNRFDNDPDALSQAVTQAGPALSESDASTEELATFFASLARLPRLAFTLTSLPVSPVAAGDDELYSTDADEIDAFVAATFAEDQVEEQIRVQVLNGNGVPGIGQDVAEKLVGQGFRVILTGNARRLDYDSTLIVTYDSSDRGIALAERARKLLGVGEIQVSAQRQGIVDLTIVVGRDFLTTL